MLDDAGNLIAEIDPNTIVDSVADEGPDAVELRDRLRPRCNRKLGTQTTLSLLDGLRGASSHEFPGRAEA